MFASHFTRLGPLAGPVVLDIARTDDLLVPLHRYLALVAVAYD